MKARSFLATVLAGCLVPALAFTPVVLTSNVTQAAASEAECQVYSVLASKTGDGTIPDNLKFLAEQLRDDQFAAYKSFRLLGNQRLSLDVKQPKKASLSSGHKLSLEYLGAKESKLQLHATLLSRTDDKQLFNAIYSIDNNGLLMIGGVRGDGGKVFFAIQCRLNKAAK